MAIRLPYIILNNTLQPTHIYLYVYLVVYITGIYLSYHYCILILVCVISSYLLGGMLTSCFRLNLLRYNSVRLYIKSNSAFINTELSLYTTHPSNNFITFIFLCEYIKHITLFTCSVFMYFPSRLF
jgi:hypothetical protein